MRDWYSASDLAGLAGLPTTERRVRSKAQREGWASRRRAAKGGGREYPLSALPIVTRIALGAGVTSQADGSDADKTEAQRLWREGHQLLRGGLAAQRQALYAQLKRLLQVRDQGLLSDAELDASVKDTVRGIEWARAQVERIEREAGSLISQESGHE